MSDPVADLIARGKPAPAIPPNEIGIEGPLPENLPKDEYGEFPWPNAFPPGKVGLIAGEHMRYTAFLHSWSKTMVAMPFGSGIQIAQGVDIPGNCNTLVRSMADHEEWLWILGDDHAWAQGTLSRLLVHLTNGADIVVPHCLKRIPPWPAVAYSHQMEPDENGREWYKSADLPEKGLTQIHACGSAGMLVKREVFEAIGDPYFRPDPNGEGLNEDLYFCQRAREAGFKIWCDPTIPFGHIGTYHVLPTWGEDGWDVAIVTGPDDWIRVPGVAKVERWAENAKTEAA